ncbi:porin family protein [soil metagenome]
MKKILATAAIAAFCFMNVSAQSPVSFGVKGGMNSTNLKFSGDGFNFNPDSKIGFYAGLLAEIGISDMFALQPEAMYALMGAKSGDDKLNLSYVNIPVLLKYKNQGLSLVAGPQLGLLVSAKEDDGSNTTDIKDQFKSTDFGLVLGAGYTTLSGFGFDARYQLGLSNIAEDIDPNINASVKNNGFTFGIHYFFNHTSR